MTDYHSLLIKRIKQILKEGENDVKPIQKSAEQGKNPDGMAEHKE